MLAVSRTNNPVRYYMTLVFALFLISSSGSAQMRVRSEPALPDIPGYRTLLCDFHMHTVFSDGEVWPEVRVKEAWREGLDAIAITDHVDLVPNVEEVRKDFNRSYEIAAPLAEKLGIILIRGAEITKDMPPGHFNMLFIKDANPIETENWLDGIKEAYAQGGFIIWNHPGWRQPGEIPVWYREHTELYEGGYMHGMEIVNERSYYPKAHQWCLDKNITMLGNSDIHDPINLFFDFENGEHRPMTLVFATERSAEAIRDALEAGRTAVWHQDLLIGRRVHLEPVFAASTRIVNPDVSITGEGTAILQLHNSSDLDLKLVKTAEVSGIALPDRLTLYAGKTVMLTLRGTVKDRSGREKVTLRYTVENLLIAPGEGLPVELNINVTFIPDTGN